MGSALKVPETKGNDLAQLADDLVQHLGVEDALRVCRENSWEGVKTLIQGRLDRTAQG